VLRNIIKKSVYEVLSNPMPLGAHCSGGFSYQVTADEIHNWHVPAIKKRLSHLSDEQKLQIADAHSRHHTAGTSAKQEAEYLNKLWAE
jgi:hypothetical protein